MPNFTNPFSGMVPDRKLTLGELVTALRMNLSAEEDATSLYLAHADATDNALAAKVLRDIADEERVHVGEFQRLICILLKDEDVWLAQGAAEVNEMAAQVAQQGGASPAAPANGVPTIGNLKSNA